MITGPVFPIVPSYTKGGSLRLEDINKYCNYLKSCGVQNVMTTAGTTQFNLLDSQEIRDINKLVSLKGFKNTILGIEPGNTNKTINEVIELHKYISPNENTYVMILYPDRYYGNYHIVDFFHSVADASKFKVLIHAMPMRNGTGGQYDYTSALLNCIFEHGNIYGMKEENTSIEQSFKNILELKNKDLSIIAAGGSMRRSSMLMDVGVQSFLSGIGSIYPEIELEYTVQLDVKELLKLENYFFHTCMSIGWHLSLRYLLYLTGHITQYSREPFPEPTELHKLGLKSVLKEITKYKEKLAC